jgi:hypothetical protein
LLVVFVAAFGCFTSAYRSGTQGARSNFRSFLLPLLLTIVVGLIYDMDHSLQGVISVSQKPLLELQETVPNEQDADEANRTKVQYRQGMSLRKLASRKGHS